VIAVTPDGQEGHGGTTLQATRLSAEEHTMMIKLLKSSSEVARTRKVLECTEGAGAAWR
jgi:hypothetical protein